MNASSYAARSPFACPTRSALCRASSLAFWIAPGVPVERRAHRRNGQHLWRADAFDPAESCLCNAMTSSIHRPQASEVSRCWAIALSISRFNAARRRRWAASSFPVARASCACAMPSARSNCSGCDKPTYVGCLRIGGLRQSGSARCR